MSRRKTIDSIVKPDLTTGATWQESVTRNNVKSSIDKVNEPVFILNEPVFIWFFFLIATVRYRLILTCPLTWFQLTCLTTDSKKLKFGQGSAVPVAHSVLGVPAASKRKGKEVDLPS